MYRKLCAVVFTLFLTLLLTSCACQRDPCNPCIIGKPVPPLCPNTSTCAVQICKEPIICTLQERNRRIAYLTEHGVKIIHVGETITVVLPSDKLFHPGSSNLSPCYLPVLRVASDFIFCYEKMTVRVAAYTDGLCSSPRRDSALTQMQAEAVASALWCNGIDARLLCAVGCGSDSPIASNITAQGQLQNRRIEICFRYIPPYAPSC
jgi:outer membrane protein OmpA-like peptidoglycan-associated protein